MDTDPVPDALSDALAGFAVGYLITLGAAPPPHVVPVVPALAGGVLHVPGLGPTSRRNVENDAAVTVLWPPPEPGGYSLIVNGHGTVSGDGVRVVPERGVLHRPSSGSSGSGDGSCAADCVELRLPDVDGSPEPRR